MSKPDLSQIFEELPPIIARTEVSRLLGGFISEGYLANLDCLGLGPDRLKIGKRTGYTRESLRKWMEERSQIISSGTCGE